MVTSSKNAEKQLEDQAFSERLNGLLDAREFTPKGKGRQVELGKKYGLTQKAVRKWVEGEGMPETVRMIQLARDFQCNFEWLALGTGPRDRAEHTVSPYAQLAARLEQASPETVKMVELALLPDADLAAIDLSPSLKGLVGFIKKQIREEMQLDPKGRDH